MYRALQGKLRSERMCFTGCCRGYFGRRGCDVQGVAGVTALGEDVMYRMLQ